MHEGKISLRTKLGFGVCDLGGNLFFTLIGFYLLFFLTDVVKLGAGLAGVALMIGKIWDAVTDPMVGYASDRTRSKWGRRRPYIFWGAITLFFAMIVMFTNPGIFGSLTQRGLFIWAALAYCLLNTAYTLINIPYGALLPELTPDYDQRTVLTGYRMTFAVVGTFIGAGAVLPIAGAFGSADIGWAVMGGATGAVMTVTGLLTFWAIREPERHVFPEHVNFIGTYWKALKDRIFLLALLPWIFHITGVTIIQTALLYYFRYIYQDEGMFTLALVFLLTSCVIFIPVWVAISKRIGKKLSYNIGMAIFAVTVMVFFFLGHILGPTFSFVVMAVAGIGFATQYVMPHAIVPDVVEHDYAENGVRREGVYYGLWTFTSKLGTALALLLSGWVLKLFGYVPEIAQTDLAKFGIRLLIGPVPAALFVAGIVILSFYPINQEFYEGILAKIAARNGGGDRRNGG